MAIAAYLGISREISGYLGLTQAIASYLRLSLAVSDLSGTEGENPISN